MYYYAVNDTTIQNDEGLYIPIDTSNANYQEYLAWIAAGNTLGSPFATPSGSSALLEFGNLCLDQSMIHNGTSGRLLYNNAGILGELTTTGTGTSVLNQGPTVINPTITSPTITGTLTAGGSAGTSGQVLQSTGTGVSYQSSTGTGDVVRTTSPTIASPTITGTLTAGGSAGTSGQILQSTGTGIQWGNLSSTVSMRADGRLTLSSNVPISGNVTSSTVLYYTPYLGNQIALYSGTAWSVLTFSQLSIAVPATANTNYDVFVYNNSGTAALELTAWTSGTVRATALTTQDGVYVRSGALTRRYVGTVRTDSTSGRISYNTSTRHVWNLYNQTSANLLAAFGGGEYTYTTQVFREAGGNTTLGQTRVQWVCGLNTAVQFSNYSLISNPSAAYAAAGIGIDRTNANDAQIFGGVSISNVSPMVSFYDDIQTAGFHYAQRVEISQELGTTTWYFSNLNFIAGLRGSLMC